jgi:mono/diheme cytochrome c family protein
MRRLGRWLLATLGVLVLVPIGGAAFLLLLRPRARPPSSETVARTPERLARGTYLVEHLLLCVHCHSDHDAERYGMPVLPGAALAGGLTIDRSFGLPGVVQPPNITPDVETGIGAWTDGELIRAIREGVHRNGRALFPMMPYGFLRAMSDEDVRAVVVYLRAQKPVRRRTHPIEVDFPVNLLVRAEPAPVEEPVASPDRSDRLAYGRYLVRIAACAACHTPMERGRPVAGEEFAGGREFPVPTSGGRFRSVTANITPDETGWFGHASREQWIGRVRSFAPLRDDPPPVAHGLNTMMPWLAYSGLTDEDLGAIYDFMRTVRPVHKVVQPFPDAPPGSALPTAAAR